MDTYDMCVDYDLKFGLKHHKLLNKEIQLGITLDKHCYGTYVGDKYEYYLCVFLFKWQISIGWFLEERK